MKPRNSKDYYCYVKSKWECQPCGCIITVNETTTNFEMTRKMYTEDGIRKPIKKLPPTCTCENLKDAKIRLLHQEVSVEELPGE